MKMDMDLIRELLIWCEVNLPNVDRSFSTDDVEIKGYTHSQIVNHTVLLIDNGYLSANEVTGFGDKSFILERLTFDGHQFLALIRSDTIWKKLKDTLGKVGLETLPVLIPLIWPYIKTLLGMA